MVKKIRLMTDYQCWPLWEFKGGRNINPADLPLSAELIERLLHWAKAFDATMNLDDPLNESCSFSAQELVEFEQEGISLWQRLQEELTPDYKVLYYSRKLNRLLSLPNELSS